MLFKNLIRFLKGLYIKQSNIFRFIAIFIFCKIIFQCYVMLCIDFYFCSAVEPLELGEKGKCFYTIFWSKIAILANKIIVNELHRFVERFDNYYTSSSTNSMDKMFQIMVVDHFRHTLLLFCHFFFFFANDSDIIPPPFFFVKIRSLLSSEL